MSAVALAITLAFLGLSPDPEPDRVAHRGGLTVRDGSAAAQQKKQPSG
jgi:hypothetical protein